MRLLAALFILILPATALSQVITSVTGKVTGENDEPLANVSVVILGRQTGVSTSDSGKFSIKVTPGRPFALVFSHTGFISVQKSFQLNAGETHNINILLKRTGELLENITIKDESERRESGRVTLDAKNTTVIPAATGGVEALIKSLVGSNNELTSQYNVRGGNYDENLVYINDFEVYRPYLVSSGQQEGLSLINPELARNVNFYMGGFQAKYGDKLSSVLDIQYKKPVRFAGSVYASLLEQGFHVEGSFKKMTYLAGIRNKSNSNVLSNQPTLGSYIPSSSDFQGFITYKASEKLQFELLGIFTKSKFSFFPESVKKTSSVFSPFYTANLGLDIYFEGQERDRYATSMVGATIVHSPSERLRLRWLVSRFENDEQENFDIAGAYLFGNRDFDNSSSTYGQIVNPLGAGYYQNYARNSLNITALVAGHRGSYTAGQHFLQWGNSIEQTKISDKLYQFEYQDSAGYSLPYSPGSQSIFNFQSNKADLTIYRYSGYIQDNLLRSGKNGDFGLQGGIRYNFNSLNKQFLISPRLQASWKPNGFRDIIFRAAVGMYNQPPFYRELRKYDGTLNREVKAQESIQFTAGFDYNLGVAKHPLRITAEAYYKSIKNVNPYDIDNVKIRYHGNNNAKAYAAGLELRLFGELVKDAESWLSIGFMKTREDLDGDHYFNYLNAAGEVINSGTEDKVVADSIKNEIGFLRRPSDRFMTIGLFLQDYLSTNRNFKVHLNALYGSNMPYNIPNNPKYRNALLIEPYIRIDMGFSAMLLGDHSKRRNYSPFKSFDNIWLSIEVLNIIDRPNTISYQLIRDFASNTYAIPNRLTPRLFNIKILARFKGN